MEEKKLNIEETIKALECCERGNAKCSACPRNISGNELRTPDCRDELRKQALDVIYCLQGEKSELLEKNEKLYELGLNEDTARFEDMKKIERLEDTVSSQKAEIERLTEKASYQRLELCKEIAELQKKVENQKAVIVGQAERMEKEKAENKRLYDEFVRLDDFCATKGCICCVCENKKTCEECSKCESLKTEKCNNFKIDVSKYTRAIERADKLQKQVDECKEIFERRAVNNLAWEAGKIVEELENIKPTIRETYGVQEQVGVDIAINRIKTMVKSKGVEVE